MTVESTAVLNQQIKDYVEKNPKTLFDPSSSYRLLSLVRTHVFGDNPAEQVNAISLLASLSDRAPKFQQISSIYDELLFDTLFSLLTKNIKLSTFNAILRVSSVFMSGRLTTHRDCILVSIQKNINIIPVIASKLYDETAIVIDFITKLLSCAVECNYIELILFMRAIRNCRLLVAICDIAQNKSISADLRVRIYKLTGAIGKVKAVLKETPINLNLTVYQSMVNEIMDLYDQNLNGAGKVSTKEDYIRAGLTEDPREFIVNNYSSVNLIDMIYFMKDPNLNFKKLYCEQVIFAHDGTVFPLSTIGVELSNFLFGDVLSTKEYPNIRENIYAVDSLYFSCMINILKIWKNSRATVDDIPVVMTYLYGLMRYADSLLALRENDDIIHSVREVLESLVLLSYQDIKKLQLEEWEDKEHKMWNLNGLDKFNDYLRSEVLEFVREQRLLKLSKGSWVYSEDPMELSLLGKKPQMYFMILSPNNSAIIYKEFKQKTKVPPNIDKTGTYLNINTIASFESTEDAVEDNSKSNSKLISLKSRSSFKKITLKHKTKKSLLTFYTDTKEASYIWLDGLKLMTNAKLNELSEDTRKQIDALTATRRSGQLANLNDDDYDHVLNLQNIQEDEIYDADVLESLTKNYYYA